MEHLTSTQQKLVDLCMGFITLTTGGLRIRRIYAETFL